MNIYEAAKRCNAENPYIARVAWNFPNYDKPNIYLEPRTSPDSCIIHSRLHDNEPWNPTLEDLLADDWRPCWFKPGGWKMPPVLTVEVSEEEWGE